MQIDWVTVIAQIVNFLILVWLLKHFLYAPIVRTMQERQQRVAAEMEEAKERQQQAEEEEREYREKRRELEEQREDRLREADRAAEDRREQLLAEARDEVQAIERRWHENLREERDSFVRELRRRLGGELCSVARQALADLANRDLQEQVVDVFLSRLEELGEERRDELRARFADSEQGPVVTSAFPLSAGQREELVSSVRDLLSGQAEVAFRVDDALLCGIGLNVGGVSIDWSLDSYLNALEESVIEALDRETRQEQEDELATAQVADAADTAARPSEGGDE